jgi:ATP-dependent Zn protease
LALLSANKDLLENTAATLLTKETFSAEDLKAIAARLLPARIDTP